MRIQEHDKRELENIPTEMFHYESKMKDLIRFIKDDFFYFFYSLNEMQENWARHNWFPDRMYAKATTISQNFKHNKLQQPHKHFRIYPF